VLPLGATGACFSKLGGAYPCISGIGEVEREDLAEEFSSYLVFEVK